MKPYLKILLSLLLLSALLLSGCVNDGGEEETTLPLSEETVDTGNGGEEESTQPSLSGETANLLFIVDNELYAIFSESGVPIAPAKQGFRFVGWYRDKGKWEQPVDVSAWSGKTLSEVFETLSYTENADLLLWARFVEVLPEGSLPGDLCYAWDIPLFEGEGDAETFNVRNAGKVTVLNFWGTWCGPCMAELPHFDEVAREYGDRIVMIAVHSYQGITDAPAYIAEHYADSPIIFGHDDARESYFLSLNGYAYPMTLVLDENGIVVAKRTGAMTKDALTALIDSVLEN
ncbi:MAG: TlpA family protein disulfide reductase [Clostridia bacterium]|nr:TlpA family protein disulfide reductase [Clostridia bacterium]